MLAWLSRFLRGGSPKTDTPSPGQILRGKYRLEAEIGRGGMGVVFAAHHVQLDRKVAVKVLLREAARDAEMSARFVREARAAANLQSEHVVQVLDVDTLDDGLPFMVMERLVGNDLGALLEESPLGLPIDLVVDYMLQALSGIARAHAMSIVHRDLKPANLFVATLPDGRQSLKILDFGIAKTGAGPDAPHLTGSQSVLGSPMYMSPEQMRSTKNADARSDIWSLGVVMYELLTGKVPFEGEGWGGVFAAVLSDDPTPPRKLRPKIPEELEAVVLRCLQRDREARFHDVAELALALAPFGSRSSEDVSKQTAAVLARGAPTIPEADSRILGVPGVPAVDAPATTTTMGPDRWTLFGRRAHPRTRALVLTGALTGLAAAGALLFWGPTRHPTAIPLASEPAASLSPEPAVPAAPAPESTPAAPLTDTRPSSTKAADAAAPRPPPRRTLTPSQPASKLPPELRRGRE